MLRNVSVSFGEKKVLSNFSLELNDKGITCISGPSGCGKTTLLRVVAGLCSIQDGDCSSDFIKPAFMFQEDRLLPWLSAFQNVAAVMPDDEKDAAAHWLELVGLKNEKEVFPSELSGGMRRRVAFARTLAYGGDLLLLDEPFKGLDPQLVEKMCNIVAEQSLPSLIITHSPEEAQLLGGNMMHLEGPPLTISEQKR